MQVPKGRDQVSGGISVPCRHATPVANDPWKPLKIRKKVEFGIKSDQKGVVIVYGQVTESHLNKVKKYVEAKRDCLINQ